MYKVNKLKDHEKVHHINFLIPFARNGSLFNRFSQTYQFPYQITSCI